jgi:uncharacterized membrane protein YqjE
MDESNPKPPGLLTVLGRLKSTVFSTFQTRLELFAVELDEERRRSLQVLFWSAATLFFAMLALIMITIAVVWACPAHARPYVLAAFCLLYLGLAIGAALVLRRQLRDRPPAFSGSLDQLKKDAACLRPGS